MMVKQYEIIRPSSDCIGKIPWNTGKKKELLTTQNSQTESSRIEPQILITSFLFEL